MEKTRGSISLIAIFVIVLLLMGAAAVAMTSLGIFGMGDTGTPGTTAEEFGAGGLGGDIPNEYREIFVKAGDKWKVQPAFLAAMFLAGEHHPRTDHFNPATPWPNISGPWASSPKGASGPFQFMPATWDSNQQDGDGDGRKDIMNMWDASFGAAHLCAMNGAGGNTTDLDSLKDAASRYNSGRPWSEGQNFSETRPYVLRVVEAFQYFYNSPGQIVPGSLANFDIFRLYQTSTGNIPIVIQKGCAVTSVSMAINYAMGNPNILTPNLAWNFYTSGEMMQWGLPTNKPSSIAGKISTTQLSSAGNTPPMNKMQCYLNSGVPVVLGATRSANSNGKIFTNSTQHWVLVIGITPDNKNFVLADPAGRNKVYPIAPLINPNNSKGTHVYATSAKINACK